MIKPFQFEDSGRTYRCSVEEARTTTTQLTAWWWFEVSDDNQRYAPFLAAKNDTKESVKTRILAYYTTLLERRAAPPQPRGRRPLQTGSAAPAAVPTPEA